MNGDLYRQRLRLIDEEIEALGLRVVSHARDGITLHRMLMDAEERRAELIADKPHEWHEAAA